MFDSMFPLLLGLFVGNCLPHGPMVNYMMRKKGSSRPQFERQASHWPPHGASAARPRSPASWCGHYSYSLSLSLSFFLPICTISITPQQGVATLFTTKNRGRVERLQSSNFGHGVADYTMDNPAASPRVVTGGNEFWITVSVQETVQNICSRTFTILIYFDGSNASHPKGCLYTIPCIILHLDQLSSQELSVQRRTVARCRTILPRKLVVRPESVLEDLYVSLPSLDRAVEQCHPNTYHHETFMCLRATTWNMMFWRTKSCSKDHLRSSCTIRRLWSGVATGPFEIWGSLIFSTQTSRSCHRAFAQCLQQLAILPLPLLQGTSRTQVTMLILDLQKRAQKKQ